MGTGGEILAIETRTDCNGNEQVEVLVADRKTERL
jgi:hypothetical protein